MKQSILAIFALVALLGYSHAQVTFEGPCPNVKVQPNFDLKKYQGIWYEHSKYPIYFEKGRKCVKAELTLKGDGSLSIKNSMVNEATNLPSSMVGSAKPIENAKLKVVFPTSSPSSSPSNYWILATDYTNYSVAYFCQPTKNNKHISTAWILTRKRVPSVNKVVEALQVLANNNISLHELQPTNQNGCSN